MAAVAGTFPEFHKWVFACPQDHPQPGGKSESVSYKPLFFSPEQYRMIEHIAEMIIPEDETPGAKTAGVAEFIDFMVANRVPISASRDIRSTEDAVASGSQAQASFILGLGWMNARCHAEFGSDFTECTAEQQNSLLEELAYKKKFRPTTETGREFFRMMRDYTVVGYYTTKIGLEGLGYPGLRTMWSNMPGCTHPDDPEHVHLREPEPSSPPVLRSTS
jgi:hypothetical protein